MDKSVTDQGITLIINEALADDSTLVLGYTIKSGGQIEDLPLAGTMIMGARVNGSSPQGGGFSGEYINPQRYDIKKDESHPNDFTMVFPALDLSQSYSICTSQLATIDFMEDLKIKIELQK